MRWRNIPNLEFELRHHGHDQSVDQSTPSWFLPQPHSLQIVSVQLECPNACQTFTCRQYLSLLAVINFHWLQKFGLCNEFGSPTRGLAFCKFSFAPFPSASLWLTFINYVVLISASWFVCIFNASQYFLFRTTLSISQDIPHLFAFSEFQRFLKNKGVVRMAELCVYWVYSITEFN